MKTRRVAILTFEGFNEIDSFVALNILNRARTHGIAAELAAPEPVVRSMNGVAIEVPRQLESVADADAVLFGSGVQTGELIGDSLLLGRIRVDPARQLLGAQCSGTLLMARLGLLARHPACTDHRTRPLLHAEGVTVLHAPFHASGNVATAGGCLAAHYLAAWVLLRLVGREAAADALGCVVPVGEEDDYVQRALRIVGG